MTLEIDRNIPSSDYIFKYKFRALYPQQASRSAEDIKYYGTPTVGDEAIDRAMANQWVDTYLTISQMVDFYKRGISVKIYDKADTASIYECISYHLNTWKNHLSSGINKKSAPLEDLRALDEFSNMVYEHAKWQFTQEIIESITVSSMRQAAGLGTSEMLSGFTRRLNENSGRRELVPEIKDESPQDVRHTQKHESLRDFFRQK